MTRRGELTPGAEPYSLDKAFLRRLKQVDPLLELYWHPIQQKWVLYRRFRPQCAPADDCLICVSVLKDRPSDWVIQLLQRRDLSRRHPYSADTESIKRHEENKLKEAEYERERSQERSLGNISEDMTHDLGMAFRGRQSMTYHDTDWRGSKD